MRILFVAHTLPFPENSGSKIRIANLLRAACALGEVQFIGYVEGGHPDDPCHAEAIRQLRELCPNAIVLARDPVWWTPFDKASTLQTLRHYVFAPGAFVFREFRCDALVEAVLKHAAEADAVWVERLWVADRLTPIGHKLVVDLDDIESVKTRRRLSGRPLSLITLAAWYDYWKTVRTERAVLDRFARAVVCSQTDVAFWPGKEERVWVVPNGFNERLLALDIPARSARRAIYVGTLDYWPNVEAAKVFCKYVMPLLTARYPDFEFWIVGRSPLPQALELDNGRNIRVFADVPDVLEYLRQASVSVVPLNVGGGTRLKILESIAAGIPVISTDIGIEGIELEPDMHYLRANTPEEFAAAVIRMIEDPALGQRQVASARTEIQRRYTWSAIRDNVSEELRSLIRTLTPSGGHAARDAGARAP